MSEKRSGTFQTRIHEFEDGVLLKNFVLPPVFDSVEVKQDDIGVEIVGVKGDDRFTIANIVKDNGGGVVMAPVCP